MSSPAALTRSSPRSRAFALPRVSARVGLALAVAAVLAAVSFVADGGQRLERTTNVEIALMLGGSLLAALALILRPARPWHGGGALLALAALAVLTALSVTWSLAPADSWEESSRTFAYLATFAGALALVRLFPGAWAGVLHGVAIACLAVCVWALLTKVFPGALAPDEIYARLRAPFDYWNAVGLMAALGVPPLLWLAARRSGHAAANALAWPGLGLLLTTLMLSYSRGALLAVAIGLAVWFAVVPLRLRAAVPLLASMAATCLPVAWAFSQSDLVNDNLPLAVRSDAGHELGALLAIMVLLLLAAGLVVNFVLARRAPSARLRHAAGRTVLGGLALIPVGIVIALAAAPGGIDGQVSKAWDQLTNPDARTPANTPGRLTAASSVRARYWREALKIHADSKLVGAGANSYATARTRFRNGPLEVRHAHGYVVQTLADLGWIGLLASLAALWAWGLAALRATGLRRGDRGLPYDAERIGLITLGVVVIVFGVHSLVDWTWFIPANAVVALLCAGWVAGRAPLAARLAGDAAPGVVAAAPGPRGLALRERWEGIRRSPVPAVAACGLLAVAIIASWSAYQPVRSVHASDIAIQRLEKGDLVGAAGVARVAAQRNPLAVAPLWEISLIEDLRGDRARALAALEGAVALQPANAEAWRRLGRYKLTVLGQPREALPAFRAAYYLDPHSPEAVSDFLEVQRALGVPPA